MKRFLRQQSRLVLPVLLWSLILAISAWVYAPGINGPPMLDDRASVMVLAQLDDNPEYALDSVLGDNSGPLGRPVSMITFVLEKLYLDQGISGGKKVNIGLHLLNGSLLLWLVLLLLRHIESPGYRWIALLLSAAWLVTPLYVSTVLYVVQRMAMLAALFMLSSCISYVYWRLALLRGERGYIALFLVFVFSVMAVFSKETAIVILPILLLLETLWFSFKGLDGVVLSWLRRTTLGLIALGAVSLVLFFLINADWLVASFETRPFTLYERVLSQSEILWQYLGQMVFPDTSRMGLYHDDIIVPKTLLASSGTLYSVIAWMVVLGLCGASIILGRGKYLVFPILLYLIGHSTESTILALELYFEHRNYFPGIGLFLLFAVLFTKLFRKLPETQAPILVCLAFYVVWLTLQTSSQVQVWSNASLLALNDVNAHPHSFRTNAEMATEMAHVGELDSALKYSRRAHQVSRSEREGDYDIRDLAISCLANEMLPAARVASIGTVDAERPLSSVATLNVLVRMLQDNTCPNFDQLLFADRMVAIYLKEGQLDKASAHIYSRLGVLENTLGRYENAYAYTNLFLALSPDDIAGLLMKLHFATALESMEEVRDLKSKLQTMDEEGKLTLAQRNTLSLYLEN